MTTDPRSSRARWILWSVVFIDLVGLGVIQPLAPFFVLRTGLGAELITLILASYSLAQFAAMPLWGALSDRIGRRPVLLASMAGHAASYLLLAFADDWPTLLAARLLGGATAANLATAYAYATDVTAPAQRSKAIGRISGAFGLGFIVGPILGGLLAGDGPVEQANLTAPALAAAALSALSFVGILLFLPESRPPEARSARPAKAVERGPGAVMARLSARPIVTALVVLGVLVIVFVAAREAILPLWAHDKLGLSPRDIGLVLAVSGVVVTLVQIFLMGPLSDRFGPARLVSGALVMFALGWVGLILSHGFAQVALATLFTAVGTALFQTCMPVLVSERAEAHERGALIGAYQSSNALARFVGQAFSGSLYRFAGQDAPFMLGAIMMAPALALSVWIARRIAAPAAPQPQPAE